MQGLSLICPIRGPLKVKAVSADGLTPTEEKRRIDAIRFLLAKGYPKANFVVEPVVKRFGNGGRNSQRADFAVLDVPVGTLQQRGVDTILEHAVLLAEIKRDSSSSVLAVNTQVLPLLDYAKLITSIAVYWSDINHRFFWTAVVGGKREQHVSPIASLPAFGQPITIRQLSYDDLQEPESLITVFDALDNLLHAWSIDQSERYGILFQFLLMKLFDEQSGSSRTNDPLVLQDFKSMGLTDSATNKRLAAVLEKASNYYNNYLPQPVQTTTTLSGHLIKEIMALRAPIKITAAKQNVVQEFYMKFAQGLYKWDLGQYFTPTPVTECIVQLVNPEFGEHVKDPACGLSLIHI